MTTREFSGRLWLNEIIDARERAIEAETDGPYGLVSGVNREIFLMRDSFNQLIHDIGAVVTYDPNWAEEHPGVGEQSFKYRGYKVFALWDKKGA